MKLMTILFLTSVAVPAFAQQQGKIEGLHHWVSESEVAALNVILAGLAEKGYSWQDSAVGGMSNARQALRTRIAAGDPPGTMQLLGFEGIDWANEGALRDLQPLAEAGGWRKAIAPAVLPFIRTEDTFFAVPINMHRNDWVWANKAVMDSAGLGVPSSWQELVDMGPKLREAGVVPLAMGDEAWQITQVLDAIMIDVGGADFYRRAVVDLDPAALGGPEMIASFDMLRQVRGLVDKGFVGRDWAVATGMVADGTAAMQVMGDWAKGEFTARGLKPDVDFLCFATPSAEANYLFNVDAFGMFQTKDEAEIAAQDALAETIMDPKVQHDFNVLKGSIPARSDVSVEDMDTCAQKSYADRAAAVEAGTMLGSTTNGFGAPPQFAAVFGDVAVQFFVGDMSSADAARMLVEGIDNAR
jgi:glucose/mannose transport system substrate-binding protein